MNYSSSISDRYSRGSSSSSSRTYSTGGSSGKSIYYIVISIILLFVFFKYVSPLISKIKDLFGFVGSEITDDQLNSTNYVKEKLTKSTKVLDDFAKVIIEDIKNPWSFSNPLVDPVVVGLQTKINSKDDFYYLAKKVGHVVVEHWYGSSDIVSLYDIVNQRSNFINGLKDSLIKKGVPLIK
jgi:hypothetical protein